MATTLLSTLVNRMNVYQTIKTQSESNKVQFLDDALRTIKRTHDLPFFQKKSSIKLFQDVFQYPPASDHDYLIYIDYTKQNLPFAWKMRNRYTSLQQFWENPDYRNQIGEIFENNTLTIGIQVNNPAYQGLTSTTLNTGESITGFTATGNANNVRIDNVNFLNGNASVAFDVTANPGTANIAWAPSSSFTDADYLRKWVFVEVFLSGEPSSIELRFGVNSSNYLSSGALTTQFAGQALNPNQWNIMAFDLNNATTVGTITTASVFNFVDAIFTNAPTGTYNIGASYYRGWCLLDYWYYSKFSVQTVGQTQANQEYFNNASDVYALDSSLVGDHEWADLVMYEAMLSCLSDKENFNIFQTVSAKRDAALARIKEKWPDNKPLTTSNNYLFGTDYSAPSYNGYGYWC